MGDHAVTRAGGGAATVVGTRIGSADPGLVSVYGSNAYDEGVTHLVAGLLPGVDVEPPDQGLCEGAGYTVELNNMVINIFKSNGLTPLSTTGEALENFFGTPEVFGAGNDGTYSVQGDPRCAYDPSTGRWFASQLWLDLNAGSPGDNSPYGVAGTFLAVSQSSDPTGAWRVYFIPDQSNAQGASTCSLSTNPCFGDQPLLGVDATRYSSRPTSTRSTTPRPTESTTSTS